MLTLTHFIGASVEALDDEQLEGIAIGFETVPSLIADLSAPLVDVYRALARSARLELALRREVADELRRMADGEVPPSV